MRNQIKGAKPNHVPSFEEAKALDTDMYLVYVYWPLEGYGRPRIFYTLEDAKMCARALLSQGYGDSRGKSQVQIIRSTSKLVGIVSAGKVVVE